MNEPGLIHRALEQELLGELSRRGILIWLDKDAAYTPYVDSLVARHAAGEFPIPVVAFRGSFLDVLFQLEPHAGGLDRPRLLIHLPGITEETVRQTPVLELYRAGTRFRKSLDTLVRETAAGRVAPDVLEQYLAQAAGALSLSEADAWLSAQLNLAREGLAGHLERLGLSVVLDALLGKNESLRTFAMTGPEREVLEAYLHRQSGMDAAWRAFFAPDANTAPLDAAAQAFTGWLLAVEYVNDLSRPPRLPALAPLPDLPPALAATCRALCRHLRAVHPDTYELLADEVEARLEAELSSATAEELGQVDTFRMEEACILEAAIRCLRDGAWEKARAWALAHTSGDSFWLQRDQSRRWAWTLVDEAALLGEVLTREPRPLQAARSLGEAVDVYSRSAFEVDRAHRRFEQRCLALLESRLPHFGDLQEILGDLRRRYRAWADALARDFTALCTEHGFLPDAALQQRTLYEQVVHPLTTGPDKVALFLVDALRFEMATELLEELTETGTVVDLKARLAELPTLTSVGMNALAPVAQGGRLQVAGAFQGFRTGEYTVRGPEERARAMGTRSVGKPALWLELSEVCEGGEKLKRQVAQAKLILITSREIDDAGEANLGLATFELTLRQLKAAWRHLRELEVKQFVFTADHGFLLQDATTAIKSYGSKRDPSRRHVLAAEPRREEGMVNVELAKLGYDGAEGFLLLREDTAVFATAGAGGSFVHGGNSPQERVIPVLTVTRKRAEVASHVEYEAVAEPMRDVAGMRRLRLRVKLSPSPQGSLGFVAAQAVSVALRVHERPEVDIRVTIKDVSGAGTLQHGRVRAAVGEEWTELFFSLEGQRDERARVEVFHPDAEERVKPAVVDGWFAVEGTAARVATAPAVAVSRPSGWQDALEDEGVRQVFLHLEAHGSITEPEATRLLGNARRFRAFSARFDSYAEQVPFRVRVEPGESGTKRYVKEGNK